MQPSLKGAEESIGLFEQAIAKDPGFAPAYAGVAAGEALDPLSIDSMRPNAWR
jgi:hypothetical protein